jgi:phosphopantetheine--protein transferase-like protein
MRKTLAPRGGCSYGRPVNQATHSAEPVSGASAIGLDIECPDSLPPSDDQRAEPFYRENFTPAEIDWCLRQPESQLSFCRLWIAKEAAIKWSWALATLRPIEIEVRHDERGRPMLRITRASHQAIARDFVLSISHSGRACMAVCIRKSANPVQDK